jgi:hypothetical protein
LAIQPVTSLTVRGAGSALPLERWLSTAQLVILATFWFWAGGVALAGHWVPRLADHRTGERPSSGRALVYPSFVLLAYYGLECGIWLAFVHAGQAAAGAGILLHSIGAEVLLLPLVLVLPILAFSTDWVNQGQRIVRHVLFFRQKARGRLQFSRSLPFAAVVVAAGMLGYEIWRASEGLPAGLLAVIIIAGIMVLLVRLARVDWHWPQDIGSAWVFAGAAFIFVDTVLLVDLNPFSPGLPDLVVNTIASLLRVPIALGALTVALVLIVKGRAGKTQLGAGGLLLALAALIVLAVSYPAALAAAGLSTPQPSDILGAVDICAAAATLIWLAAARRRPARGQQTVLLRSTLVLLIGLLSVRGAYAGLQLIAGLGPQYTVLLAALFLLPPLWTYLLPAAQRRLAKPLQAHAPGLAKLVRVLDGTQEEAKTADDAQPEALQLMQTGYVFISNCLFVYLGTFREPVSGAVLPSFLSSDLTASAGLLLLAPPVVVVGFILRIRHRRPRATSAAHRSTSPGSADSVPLRVAGSAAVVTVVVTAVLFAVAFPRTLHASENQSYTAAVPGANCDGGDAYWALTPPVPIRIDCAHAALELTVPAQKTNVMTFIPPNGDFVEDYRASVRVDFVRLARGCLSIETRVTFAGYFWANVCDTGAWAVARFTGDARVFLADGAVAPARTYSVTVTAEGGNERLAIDGRQVASVSDPRFSGTHNLAVGIENLTSQPGTAAISHFVFAPLRQPARSSAQAPYLATTPGSCDKGAAQWALMTPLSARIGCQAQGAALSVPAHTFGQVGFTPPGGIFPPDYRVSILANLRRMPGGCAVIGVRMIGIDGYRDAVCANGAWSIDVSNGVTSAVLAHGTVARKGTYALQATADGTGQSLAIDGAEVGHVQDPSLMNTAFALVEAANLGAHAGSVVFSDFAFTPLR